MEFAGVDAGKPPAVDGISLVPTLLGKTQADHSFLYREFASYGGQQSVRVGDWKAIRQNILRGNLRIELYNLADDVGEQIDVAQQNPEVVERLRRIMEQQHRPSDIFPIRTLDADVPDGN